MYARENTLLGEKMQIAGLAGLTNDPDNGKYTLEICKKHAGPFIP